MYARFATVPIGAGLAVLDDGATLTTTTGSATLAHTARSDIAQSAGVHGLEFVAWGASAAPLMAIGVLTDAASLDSIIGTHAASVGWRLDTGAVYIGGAVVASGLPIPAKGEYVGLRVDLDAGTIAFYHGENPVHTRALPASGDWYFGVSLGSTVAGEIACAVNAGQWIPASAAAAAGWESAIPAPPDLRLADMDWLSASTDTPANARYEGLIDVAGIELFSAMHHWAWAGDPPMQGGNAQVTVLDAEGVLDDLAQQQLSGVQVALRTVALPLPDMTPPVPPVETGIFYADETGAIYTDDTGAYYAFGA